MTPHIHVCNIYIHTHKMFMFTCVSPSTCDNHSCQSHLLSSLRQFVLFFATVLARVACPHDSRDAPVSTSHLYRNPRTADVHWCIWPNVGSRHLNSGSHALDKKTLPTKASHQSKIEVIMKPADNLIVNRYFPVPTD